MPTREEILAAAQRVVREHGVSRATTKLIAEAAGCSEGSLYNHFSGKEELLGLVLHRGLAASGSGPHGMAELAGTGDVEGNLRTIARTVVAFCGHFVPMMPVMMADPATMRARAQAVDAAGHGPRHVVLALGEYLRREQELGRVAPDADVDGAAMAVIGACFQQTLITHVLGMELDVNDLVAHVAAAVTHGLGATAPGSPEEQE